MSTYLTVIIIYIYIYVLDHDIINDNRVVIDKIVELYEGETAKKVLLMKRLSSSQGGKDLKTLTKLLTSDEVSFHNCIHCRHKRFLDIRALL